jgi:hypothetical protein
LEEKVDGLVGIMSERMEMVEGKRVLSIWEARLNMGVGFEISLVP